MTRCPTCDRDSSCSWRCEYCGRDLVGVDDDDDDPDAAPLVADGGQRVKRAGGISPLACPRGHRNLELSQTTVRCGTCRDHGQRHVWPREQVVDLREEDPPLASDGGEGGPAPEAKRETAPDIDPEDIDELYYSRGRGGSRRRLHISRDCPEVRKMKGVASCPATHPPARASLCEVCAPDLTVDDVRSPLTDGGRVPSGPSATNRDPRTRERRRERDSVCASERGGVGDQSGGCPHVDPGEPPCAECFFTGGDC